jgi:diaminopimelate epimerase
MHGTLNDFIVLDQRTQTIDDLAQFARAVCNRRSGIGADGVIVLLPSDRADARMRVINADGSEAEMCGNGMRCAIRFLCERGEGDRFRIETLAGIIGAEVLDKGEIYHIRLDMGVPQFPAPTRAVNGATYVSMGNPHAVIFVADIGAFDLPAAGEMMPELNVHAAHVEDRHHMSVRHYERGVGLTQACGTGAVACAAAAMQRGLVDMPVTVQVPGGTLEVDWDGTGSAYLTGPAVRVFDARI